MSPLEHVRILAALFVWLLTFCTAAFAAYSCLWLPYPPRTERYQEGDEQITEREIPSWWLYRAIWLYGVTLLLCGVVCGIFGLVFYFYSLLS
jgi:hypothetical protein